MKSSAKPTARKAKSTPLLYPYQQRYLKDQSRFKAGLFARQTGKTFTTTLEAVLDCLEAEARGRSSRWTILSVSQARAQDAMEQGVKLHLRALKTAFEAAQVRLESEELAFEVRLRRGSRLRCVAANPATARGMTENLILDEFAHHKDNRAVWTALLPVVSRSDLKLRVISTPAGRGDKFYEIMTGPEMARTFSRHRVTIQDAVADGLPRDVEALRAAMADPQAWAQEFECEFVDEAHAWLTYDLIDGCEEAEAGKPSAYGGKPCYVGMDIAARGDLTVIAVLEESGARLWCRELAELRQTSFAAQLAELDRIMRQYRVVRVAMDQTGMGEMPVEEARRRHGSYRVEGVLFTPARKLDLAGALREAMEERKLALPSRAALRNDLHAVRRVMGPTGAPRLVAQRGQEGHADRFWSLALACAAAKTPVEVFDYRPVPRRYNPAADHDRRRVRATAGFARGVL